MEVRSRSLQSHPNMSSLMSASRKEPTACDKSEGSKRPQVARKKARKPRIKERDGSMPSITFGHPSDFTSNSTRKAVRSFVTAKQHEATRAKNSSVPQEHGQQQSAAKASPPYPVPGAESASSGPVFEHTVSVPSEISYAADSLLQLRTSQARHLATASDATPSSAGQVYSLLPSRSGSATRSTPSRESSLPSFWQMFPSEDQLPPSGAGSIFGDMIDYMQRIFTPLA